MRTRSIFLPLIATSVSVALTVIGADLLTPVTSAAVSSTSSAATSSAAVKTTGTTPASSKLLGHTTKATPSQTTPSQAKTPKAAPAHSTPTKSAPTKQKPVNCKVKKCIALTFDDGPGASTSTLLKTLKTKKAPATFFVLGIQVEKYPAQVKAAAAAGHEIGIHTWDHADLTKLSASAISSEISRTATLLKRTTGMQPTLLRPPYGATNRGVESAAKNAGLAEILWSIDPQDWKDRNAATVTQRVLGAARPGSIALMHDIHPTTVAAVPAIVDGLRKQGYTFVTVTQLLGKPMPGQKYSAR